MFILEKKYSIKKFWDILVIYYVFFFGYNIVFLDKV